MIQLIGISDIQNLKPISTNVDITKKLNFCIEEAQKYDVMPFLGDSLYIELESDFNAGSPQFSQQKYSKLFNGSDYTYGGRTFRNGGIKSMLVYYAYSRYVSNSNVNHSAFGLVEKISDHSTGVSKETLARQVSNATALAEAEKSKVENFLRLHLSDYGSWIYADKYNMNAPSGLKINAIGGDRRNKIASTYRCRRCNHYNCICKYF